MFSKSLSKLIPLDSRSSTPISLFTLSTIELPVGLLGAHSICSMFLISRKFLNCADKNCLPLSVMHLSGTGCFDNQIFFYSVYMVSACVSKIIAISVYHVNISLTTNMLKNLSFMLVLKCLNLIGPFISMAIHSFLCLVLFFVFHNTIFLRRIHFPVTGLTFFRYLITKYSCIWKISVLFDNL